MNVERTNLKRDQYRLNLELILLVLVVGFTAVPVELREFDWATLSHDWNIRDLAANLLGYIPVGMVLARIGFARGVTAASLLSLAAESCQFFTMHRFPSPSDSALNAAGGAIGILISRHWRQREWAIPLQPRIAWFSVVAAVSILVLKGWSEWGYVTDTLSREQLIVNGGGAISPGVLEAHWGFEETPDSEVSDSSGNGVTGSLRGQAAVVNGDRGKVLGLDDAKGYADFGHPAGLRLMGSMTVCAWINSHSFPRDDAAIVSAHLPGYQLDTTIDRGQRTIGFKLVDPCGNLMARYGRTPLIPDTWYHVAGVYDADARRLNVYLNGRPDDGYLLGSVAPAQQASSRRVTVGRRADGPGYEFVGLIDDVQIISRALTQQEVSHAMQGRQTHVTMRTGRLESSKANAVLDARGSGRATLCHQPTRPDDALVPGFVVAMGILAGIACACYHPVYRWLPVIGAAAIGVASLPAAGMILPRYFLWAVPILSFAGGASVAMSLRTAPPK